MYTCNSACPPESVHSDVKANVSYAFAALGSMGADVVLQLPLQKNFLLMIQVAFGNNVH